jgi:hypothetical protein
MKSMMICLRGTYSNARIKVQIAEKGRQSGALCFLYVALHV